MAKLIIYRGLPGSGKSTFAKSNVEQLRKLGLQVEHLEADMYFEDAKGNYKYDPTKIKEAHRWCQEQTKKFLGNGVTVIVSNTFTTAWEMLPYFRMLPWEDILVLVATGTYDNVHGVPPEVIEKMKKRWEAIPGEYTIVDDDAVAA
jgi:tRNA uridine 5-carbamoylmethylation protein Kti12